MSRPERLVLLVIIAGTVIRLASGALIGLSVDESYQVAVSRPLSASYFDHPPLSFWIPALTARLTGRDSALALRAPFILLFAISTGLMYRLGARLFSSSAGAVGVLLLGVSPIFAVTTGGWVLPDGPLTASLLAAALAFARAIEPGEPHPFRWWLASGAASGLAMLSKYHGVFVLAAAFVFLATRREERGWLRRSEPWIAAALALLIASPVVWWNVRHDWISFRFQGARGLPSAHPAIPASFARTVAGQALYLFPWIWPLLVARFVSSLRAGPRDRPRWLLACFAAGPILVFNAAALGGRPGLGHWEAPGYLFLFPLAGDAVARALARGSRVTRAWLALSVAVFPLILGVVLAQAASGWLSRAEPAWFARGDPTWEVIEWRELRPAVTRLTGEMAARADAEGAPLAKRAPFIAATRWMDAGKVARALGSGTAVVALGDRPHHFQFVHPASAFLGRDAIIVGPPEDARRDPGAARDVTPVPPRGVPPELAAAFERVEPLETVVIHRRGHAEFALPLWRGTRLRSAPAGESSR